MAAESLTDSVGVLDRMTAILEAFDEDDRGLGLSELAVRAGLPKSTVSRLVATLVRQRYLERDGRRIHLGLRLFELGQLAEQPRELRIAALPVMAELRNRTGENAHLAIRDGAEMICIAAMRGRSGTSLAVRTGGRLAVHATALGKAVLAYAAPDDVAGVLTTRLTAFTPATVVDPSRLRQQLEAIRSGAPAVEVRESAADVCAVASPVVAPSGAVVAAISVSGTADAFDLDLWSGAVDAAALALSHRLAQSSRDSG
ncbi:IclR family transcriptional regulator [Microbacterium hibisci]|uniref:IclR family transcriptional regulator n=1 Tax=Microbacterium hibisci TaxID=2036000 RepID=UPI0019413903|nr:IclR family transcriptional regulator [Microbacterium hibisci]